MPTMIQTRISSTARALRIIGDTWTVFILRQAFRGTRRFGDWVDALRIPRPVLSSRLTRLLEAGVMEKRQYSSRPVRYEYLLTAMGQDLWKYLILLWDWEKHWVPGGARSRRDMRHRLCGRLSRPVVCCDQCHGPVFQSEVDELPGPGAGFEPRVAPRWQRRTTVATVEGEREDGGYRSQTARIIGTRWSNMIIYALARGVNRFSDIERELHISPRLLTQRLNELVDYAIVCKRTEDLDRAAPAYRLTAKGWALYQARLLAIAWGDRWLSGSQGIPAILVHKACNHPFVAELRCSECDELLRPGEFHFEPASERGFSDLHDIT